MAKPDVITVAAMKELFTEFQGKIKDDFQIWLASDEEGNQFSPMLENPELSFAIDSDNRRIILYPSGL